MGGYAAVSLIVAPTIGEGLGARYLCSLRKTVRFRVSRSLRRKLNLWPIMVTRNTRMRDFFHCFVSDQMEDAIFDASSRNLAGSDAPPPWEASAFSEYMGMI